MLVLYGAEGKSTLSCCTCPNTQLSGRWQRRRTARCCNVLRTLTNSGESGNVEGNTVSD